MKPIDATDWFARRHIGPSAGERDLMLQAIGAPSLDALVDEAIPTSIRLPRPLNLPGPESEHQFLERLTQVARRNKTFRSYIGLGYHDTITPSVILRMVMENPGWYTPYTPYQAEIAQGRLESPLNFQTMVADLTGMEVANASLLDEGTAVAEAMTLLHRVRGNKTGEGEPNRFLVSDRCLPQTIDILRMRAEALDIEHVNLLHPDKPAKAPYVRECFGDRQGPFIAATDYMKIVPDQIRQWVPGRYVVLGTDGYGRSDSRAQLRKHFEVDRHHIVVAALKALADDGKLDAATVKGAMKKFNIDPDKPNPVTQ